MKRLIIAISPILLFFGCVNVGSDFKDKISEAGRIVVRNGGNVCCDKITPPASMKIWFEIDDINKVKEVVDNLDFIGDAHKNDCQCCGKPRIEWYKGTNLLAVTTIKHGRALMI